MMIEPCFSGSAPVFFLAPPSQRYQDNVAQPKLLAKPSGYLVAVHAWHANIQKNDFRQELRAVERAD